MKVLNPVVLGEIESKHPAKPKLFALLRSRYLRTRCPSKKISVFNETEGWRGAGKLNKKGHQKTKEVLMFAITFNIF